MYQQPLTPIPVRTANRLSIFLSVGCAIGLMMTFSETDEAGNDHVFSSLRRKMSSLATVGEEDAAAIRASRKKREES